MSVDETDTPTSHAEHLFIARELRRLGVRWVSLAPRYVGRFEKGVDYIGDLGAFEADFAGHAAIARALGPYKLSLHTGSDKFSIYDIATRSAGGLLHLKTAGTSYLEALRATASFDPTLFREILALAHRAVRDRQGELSHLCGPDEGAAARHTVGRATAWPAGAVRRPAGAACHLRLGADIARPGSPPDGRSHPQRRSATTTCSNDTSSDISIHWQVKHEIRL